MIKLLICLIGLVLISSCKTPKAQCEAYSQNKEIKKDHYK